MWSDDHGLDVQLDNIHPPFAQLASEKRYFALSPEIRDFATDIPRPAVLAALQRRGHDTQKCLVAAEKLAAQDKEFKEQSGEQVGPEQHRALVDRYLTMFLGKMLRRICALGAEPPQQKGKGEIPPAEAYSEQGPRFIRRELTGQGTWQCFSEAQAMPDPMTMPEKTTTTTPDTAPVAGDDDDMLNQLGRMGVDTAALSGCTPEALAEFMRALSQATQPVPEPAPDAAPPMAEPPMMPDQMVPEPVKGPGEEEEPKPPGTAYGEPYAEFDDDPDEMDDEKKKTFGEKAMCAYNKSRKFMDRCGMKYGEEEDKKIGPMGDLNVMTAEDTKKFSEQITATAEAAAAKKFKAMEANLRKQMEADATSVLNVLKTEKEATRKRAYQSFCEEQWKAGKLFPGEYKPLISKDADAGHGTLLALLLHADNAERVHKFSEAPGKPVQQLTQAQLLMKTIEQRRSIYKERVPTGGKPTDGNEEVAAVEAHYESFSETFAATRTTKENFVKAFKAQQAKNPKFTAAQYLGQAKSTL